MTYPSNTKESVVSDIKNLSDRLKNLEQNLFAEPKKKHVKKADNKNVTLEENVKIFNKLFPSLSFIAFITMLIMALYEVVKQEIIPEITVWESHLVTIVFSGIVAPIAAFFVLRRFELLNRKSELDNLQRMVSEQELQRYKDELELRVKERTFQVNSANQRLRDEIELHKKTGNALLTIEKRYKHIFKKSPVGIFNYSTQFKITEFNDKFVELFGTDSSDIKNIELKDIVDKSVMPALKSALTGVDGVYEGYYKATVTDAEGIISLRTAPFYDENNKIKGGIGIVENISERKRTEDTLLKAKEQAERSNKLKSEFLASMSHEIRTPINTILSFNSLIKEEVAEMVDDDLKVSFDHMEKAGKRIIRTIDLILNMSELQTKTFEYQPKEINIFDEVLIDIFHEYRKEAILKGLDFNLIKETENTSKYCDEYSLRQIFGNIVDNAIKYTHNGFVEINVKEVDDYLIVDVKDSGIGISDDYKAKLFTPFSQEEMGYTRKFEGNGLGLALVKEYADINKLKIDVESKKNEGSVFSICFPN